MNTPAWAYHISSPLPLQQESPLDCHSRDAKKSIASCLPRSSQSSSAACLSMPGGLSIPTSLPTRAPPIVTIDAPARTHSPSCEGPSPPDTMTFAFLNGPTARTWESVEGVYAPAGNSLTASAPSDSMAPISDGVMPPGRARAPSACAAAVSPAGLIGDVTKRAPQRTAARACLADITVAAPMVTLGGTVRASSRSTSRAPGESRATSIAEQPSMSASSIPLANIRSGCPPLRTATTRASSSRESVSLALASPASLEPRALLGAFWADVAARISWSFSTSFRTVATFPRYSRLGSAASLTTSSMMRIF
mmetsp:Transcript_8125/g.20180  ORF Transcript_8125/g.20180 Transcript_8125/m.20180 type:complete len:308 (-) Transcript_8125:59-982(-)